MTGLHEPIFYNTLLLFEKWNNIKNISSKNSLTVHNDLIRSMGNHTINPDRFGEYL